LLVITSILKCPQHKFRVQNYWKNDFHSMQLMNFKIVNRQRLIHDVRESTPVGIECLILFSIGS
jgi:hypothetical protein